jgi:hypothetical protein
MHVFEYQWRGLPHFHMVVKLENVPDFSDKEAVKEFIDEFIFAEMPRKENFPNLTPVKLETYRETISAHMVHKCAAAINGCKKHIDDLCNMDTVAQKLNLRLGMIAEVIGTTGDVPNKTYEWFHTTTLCV